MKRDLFERALYEPKRLSVEELKPRAMLFFDFIKVSNDPDAEDTWYQICENWDINVWKCASDAPLCMTAYHCELGEDGTYHTNTQSDWVELVDEGKFPVLEQELADFLENFGNREFYSVCTGRISGEFCYADYDYTDGEDIMFKLIWGINDGDENTTHIENFRISIADFKAYPNFQDKYDHCQSK